MDVPSAESPTTPRLTYDPEWLAITRAFHPYLSTSRLQPRLPDQAEAREKLKKELEWVTENIGTRDILDCQEFRPTAPGPGSEGTNRNRQRSSSFPDSSRAPELILYIILQHLGIQIDRPRHCASCSRLKIRSTLFPKESILILISSLRQRPRRMTRREKRWEADTESEKKSCSLLDHESRWRISHT